MMRRFATLALLLLSSATRADGPQDNLIDNVRPVPPPGVAVPAEVRDDLQRGLDALAREIASLAPAVKGKPALGDLVPDVQVFHRAVDVALKHNEFHDAKEFALAKKLLAMGLDRAKSLKAGEAP